MPYTYEVEISEHHEKKFFYFTALDKAEYFIFNECDEFEVSTEITKERLMKETYNKKNLNLYNMQGIETGTIYKKYIISILKVN